MAPMAIAPPSPATAPARMLRRSLRKIAWLAARRQSHFTFTRPRSHLRIKSKGMLRSKTRSEPSQKKRGGRLFCRPLVFDRKILLQVADRGQVGRELDDAGRAAPVGFEAERVDRGNAACRRDLRGVVAGEGVAGTLGEVGVGVAQVQREDLVGEADADVPGVVAGLRNTGSEGRVDQAGAVERI